MEKRWVTWSVAINYNYAKCIFSVVIVSFQHFRRRRPILQRISAICIGVLKSSLKRGKGMNRTSLGLLPANIYRYPWAYGSFAMRSIGRS